MRLVMAFAVFLFVRQALAEDEISRAPDDVDIRVKVVEAHPTKGKKLLAEPVLQTKIGRPTCLNCGHEVPMKIPIGGGHESIEWVALGAFFEFKPERVEGDKIWGVVTAGSVHLIEDSKGKFKTRTTSEKCSGWYAIGQKYETEPIEQYLGRESRVHVEYKIELPKASQTERKP